MLFNSTLAKGHWNAHKVELALWTFHYASHEENQKKKRSATADINLSVKRQRMK